VAQLGYSMENDTAFIGIFKKIFLIAMSALILTAVMVGWFMARRALSGVEAVTRTARNKFPNPTLVGGCPSWRATKRSTAWH
jgi:hypothetical protein